MLENENNYVGETDSFSVISGQTVTANMKTSRTPTNLRRLFTIDFNGTLPHQNKGKTSCGN